MKRASAWIIVTLSILIIALLLMLGYLLWWKPKSTPVNTQANVNSFESCLSAGNAVIQTSPRKCKDPTTGVTYTENSPQPQPAEQTPTTHSYTSEKGVVIQLDNWTDNNTLSSPYTLTGRVPGSWSFEASFPVELRSSDGATLMQTPAKLTGDWMTTDLVPFSVGLTLTGAGGTKNGVLILHKDNPSGLAQNDDKLELKVRY